jgi:hypothetical protein
LNGLPVALTTASSFTVKAWVEYAVAHLCAQSGIHDPTAQAYIAGVAGGVTAGLVQVAASKFWGTLFNYFFSVETFTRAQGESQILLEMLTNDLPVLLGFIGMYAAHDFLQPGSFSPTDVGAPVRKTCANLTGGFVTGVMIYAIRSAMARCGYYTEGRLPDLSPRDLRNSVLDDPVKTIFKKKPNRNRTVGNQFAGRVVGGAVGQLLAVLLMLTGGAEKQIGKGASGAGMLTFLFGWFAFIHLFEWIGFQCDYAKRQQQHAARAGNGSGAAPTEHVIVEIDGDGDGSDNESVTVKTKPVITDPEEVEVVEDDDDELPEIQ